MATSLPLEVSDAVVALDILSVDPAEQGRVLAGLRPFLATTVLRRPGCLGVALYRSDDGSRVASYARWASPADHAAFEADGEARESAPRLGLAEAADAHLYALEFVAPEGRRSIVVDEQTTSLGVFRVAPADQARLLARQRQEVDEALGQVPGMSAHFHRSLDGTRVVNLALLPSRADLERLARLPKFSPAAGYWRDVASNEFHAYRAVDVWTPAEP